MCHKPLKLGNHHLWGKENAGRTPPRCLPVTQFSPALSARWCHTGDSQLIIGGYSRVIAIAKSFFR